MYSRICHVSSAHKPFDSRIFEKEATSLAANGYDVSLVVSNIDDQEKNSVKIFGVKYKSQSRLYRFIKGAKLVCKRAAELKAEVYHLHDPELLFRVGYLKRKTKAKIIFDSHEDIFNILLDRDYIPKAAKKIILPIIRYFLARELKKVDAIVVVTPEFLETYKGLAPKMELISNFPKLLDIPEDEPVGEAAASEAVEPLATAVAAAEHVAAEATECAVAAFPETSAPAQYRGGSKPNLIFVGGILRLWNISRILDAIEGIDCTLSICGIKDEAYLKELEQHSQWHKVNYMGFLNRPRLYQEYKKADLGLAVMLPRANNVDNSGTLGVIKFFEYMMVPIPIVASNFPRWKNIIESGDCGLSVDPFSVQEIREAIKELLKDRGEWERRAKNARHLAETKYNWKTEEAKLLSLYRSL